jgi:hypothetical protein
MLELERNFSTQAPTRSMIWAAGSKRAKVCTLKQIGRRHVQDEVWRARHKVDSGAMVEIVAKEFRQRSSSFSNSAACQMGARAYLHEDNDMFNIVEAT